MNKFTRHQGESLAYKRGVQIDGVDQTLTTGWTCKVVVKPVSAGLSGTASINRIVTELTDTDTRYVVRITPAEMAALSPGQYHIITEMVNTGSSINDESQDHLEVTDQGAT